MLSNRTHHAPGGARSIPEQRTHKLLEDVSVGLSIHRDMRRKRVRGRRDAERELEHHAIRAEGGQNRGGEGRSTVAVPLLWATSIIHSRSVASMRNCRSVG